MESLSFLGSILLQALLADVEAEVEAPVVDNEFREKGDDTPNEGMWPVWRAPHIVPYPSQRCLCICVC